MKRCSTVILCFFLYTGIFSQAKLLTVAESSDFKSTSSYTDVIKFIEQLKISSDFIRVENIAESTEGRSIPLLIIGNPLPESAASLKNDARIVVYIQANIHAGEVEGKEASLMFARDLLSANDPKLLRDIVLLICPNFNPDGNEKISPINRTHQNGPVNGVGLRHNGQFLDLNRDAMKAESPEVRGVIKRVFNEWDPAVFMDCHTTNGSYHVEPVTFTWMVNPNGDNSLIKYMREKMIPEISGTLRNKYKVENCYYGEFIDMLNPEKGWYFEAVDPRYMSNYIGLRNRLGILNENYVYADYRSRVMGCYYLIRSLAEYSAANKDEINKMLDETDLRTISRGMNPSITDSFAIEYKVRSLPEKVSIKTYEAELLTDPSGRRSYRPTDRQKDVTVPYFIDYYPSKSVRFPFAYIITQPDREVIELLLLQGLKVEKLSQKVTVEAEKFEITELRGSARLNQGHYTNTVQGRYLSGTVEFPAGTVIVRTSQPLANIATYLLEPQSNDGLMTWNFFDRYLLPQWGAGYYPYPVFRIIDPVEIKSEPVISGYIYQRQ